jgi:hypothetical protein
MLIPHWSLAMNKPSPEIDTGGLMSLCYNAAIMQNVLRFANNNNNDNDDLRIVGRSMAG